MIMEPGWKSSRQQHEKSLKVSESTTPKRKDRIVALHAPRELVKAAERHLEIQAKKGSSGTKR